MQRGTLDLIPALDVLSGVPFSFCESFLEVF